VIVWGGQTASVPLYFQECLLLFGIAPALLQTPFIHVRCDVTLRHVNK
jgi:hypothetical protein